MTTGPIPVNLPRVSPHIQPAATQPNTPVQADPHLTRDVQATAQAITAADKTDNPVNDQVRQREGQRLRADKPLNAQRARQDGTARRPELNDPTRAFDDTARADLEDPPILDTFA